MKEINSSLEIKERAIKKVLSDKISDLSHHQNTMSKKKWKADHATQRKLIRYNHVMELLIEFMVVYDGSYSDYTLQDFWTWLQKKRDEE